MSVSTLAVEKVCAIVWSPVPDLPDIWATVPIPSGSVADATIVTPVVAVQAVLKPYRPLVPAVRGAVMK